MRLWMFLLVLLRPSLYHQRQRHRQNLVVAHGWSPQPGDVVRIDRAVLAHTRLASDPRVRDALGRASRTLEAAAAATTATASSSSTAGGFPLPFVDRSSFLRLEYGIFRGTSALRNEQDGDDALLKLHEELPKACLALLLLLEGRGDAAHEVVLGVTLQNFPQAEHAATHPPSNWSHLHPLSDDDDVVHSIIHRWEGEWVGEGNHTGWENAKYWACGGPKVLDGPDLVAHPVRQALAALVAKRAPRVARRVVVAPSAEPRHHQIISGGGSQRQVSVPSGGWDPVEFINLKRRLSLSSILDGPAIMSDTESDDDDPCCWQEICLVECLEISLLIRCTLLRQAGVTSQEIRKELLRCD